MSKSVWKYELGRGKRTVFMPAGAKVLDVQAQGLNIKLWALVDPEALQEQRSFMIYGTGHLMPDDPGKYIATVQLYEGMLMYHVFEVQA